MKCILKDFRRIFFIITIILSISLLFVYPLFNISYNIYLGPISGPPDILNMLPLAYWILTGVILALLVLQILIAQNNFEIKVRNLFLVVFIPVMIYASLPISQLPSIYTVNDAVGHLANAENVILNTNISTPATGYLQFPGTALMVAILGNILGITGGIPLLALGIVLNSLFVILISLFLFAVGNSLIGPRNGFVLPLLYFLVNTGFFTQFCPQNFALMLYFMVITIFSFLSEKSIPSKRGTIVFIFIGAIIVITHPITSVFIVATFGGLYLSRKVLKINSGAPIFFAFLLCIPLMLICWWIFFATENFIATVSSLYTLLHNGLQFTPTHTIVQTLSTPFSQFISFFSKGVQFSLAAVAAIGLIVTYLKRKSKTPHTLLIAISIGLAIISIFPIVLINGEFADRPLQFVYFPICALAIVGLEHFSSLLHKKKYSTKTWRTLGICALILLVPLAFVYHHQIDSIENVVPADFSITAFLVKYSPSASVYFPWSTGMRAEYYFHEPAIANINVVHAPTPLMDPYIFVAWMTNPQMLVFSMKETRYFEYMEFKSSDDYDQRFSYLNETFAWARVYDNGINNAYLNTNFVNRW